MSTEVAHKIEEPVAPAAVESKVEAPAAVEPATQAPVVEASPEVTEPVVETPEEVKPFEEGVLGYKGPGLLKSLFPSKKFFWFGSEPVEHKSLSSYLRGEKAQDAASKNVAWAAHTGKGLLFFSKKATDKASPAGLFNLSEVSDITEEHASSVTFTYGGHKHTLEAPSAAERDNLVAVLKSKAAEATELAPTVTESEAYKKYLNPTPVVAAAPVVASEASEAPVETPATTTETPTITEPIKAAEEKVDEKKSRTKSRSASRKRNSIFGGFGLGKKEEKNEISKEEFAAQDTPVVASDAPEIPAIATTEPTASTEPVAVTEPAPAVEETIPAVEEASRPAPSKRNSIFGTLQSRFSGKNEKKTHESPIIAKEDLVASADSTAPIIPVVSDPSAATETPAQATETPVETTEAPVTPATKEKRKSSLPFGLGKKLTMKKEKSEKQALAEETPVTAEKPVTAEEKAIETPSEAAVISEPTPIHTTTPQVAATTA